MSITAIQQNFQSMLYGAWDHAYNEGQKIVSEANGLVDKADSSLLQPVINLGRKYCPIFLAFGQALLELVVKVIKIAIIGGLFFAQPTFFMLGAAAAIVFPEQMRSAVERISKVWDSLPGSIRFSIFAPFPFAWPSYFLIAAPFVGAYVSLFLQDKAGVVRSPPPAIETTHHQRSVPRTTRTVRQFPSRSHRLSVSQKRDHKSSRAIRQRVQFHSNADVAASQVKRRRRDLPTETSVAPSKPEQVISNLTSEPLSTTSDGKS